MKSCINTQIVECNVFVARKLSMNAHMLVKPGGEDMMVDISFIREVKANLCDSRFIDRLCRGYVVGIGSMLRVKLEIIYPLYTNGHPRGQPMLNIVDVLEVVELK